MKKFKKNFLRKVGLELNVGKVSAVLLVFCTLFLISCRSSENRHLSGDDYIDSADTTGIVVVSLKDVIANRYNGILDYSSYVCDITYTPLETTMESAFSDIEFCFCSDKYVYLCSGKMEADIRIFDKAGHFVRAIRHGNGPGELTCLMCAVFSTKIDELIVLSDNKTLDYYSPDGVYERTVELPWSTYFFVETEDGYLFDIQYFSIDKNADFRTHVLVKTDEELLPEWYSTTFTRIIGSSIPQLRTLDDGTVSFSINPFGEYYGVFGSQLKQRYFYDCGQYSMTYKMFKDESEKRFIKIWEKGELCSCCSHSETDSHNYIDLSLNGYAVNCFIDKTSLNSIGSVVYSSSSIPFNFPIGTYNSQFVSLVEAPEVCSFVKEVKEGQDYNKQLISPETLSKLEQVQADDNPVMIFYRMKSF